MSIAIGVSKFEIEQNRNETMREAINMYNHKNPNYADLVMGFYNKLK